MFACFTFVSSENKLDLFQETWLLEEVTSTDIK